MKRDFSELARLWVETYGEDILQLPWKRIVEIANQCIDAGLVSKMEPVQPAEGAYLVSEVENTLSRAERARAEADAAMPIIAGTETQVRWAEEIRRDAITKAYILCREARQRQDEYTASRLTAYVDGVLRKKDNARWFIDNRFDFTEFQLITKHKPIKKYEVMSFAESEARCEISLLPRSPKAFPLQIALLADGSLALCARSNDLAEIFIKHHLVWEPDLAGWRKIPPEDERMDQAAEIAADLVEKGFIAEVCDPDVRRKARDLLMMRERKERGNHRSDVQGRSAATEPFQ